MSRVGKEPVVIPAEVEVSIGGHSVSVKGPKGSLSREFHPGISVSQDGTMIVVNRANDNKLHRSLHGTSRALIANMVEGVSKGFNKNLELVGVGYRAAKQGSKLVLTVGYSHPVEIIPEEGVEFEVPAPNRVVVKGIDKEKVGAIAAKIRGVREPEPYKGKGIRYEGEVIRRKVGKTGGGKGGGKAGKK